jgi:hypothetical protein
MSFCTIVFQGHIHYILLRLYDKIHDKFHKVILKRLLVATYDISLTVKFNLCLFICVSGVSILSLSFYDFSIEFWKYPNNVVMFISHIFLYAFHS